MATGVLQLRYPVHRGTLDVTVEDAAVMGVNAMDPTRAGAIARQTRASTLLRLARADTRSRLAALA